MSRAPSAGAAVDSGRDIVLRLFAASLKAVDPAEAVRRVLTRHGDELRVGDERIATPGVVFVAAIGKAAVAMTQGALEALATSDITGQVITKEGHAHSGLPHAIAVHEAGHPIPDGRGVEATRLLLNELATLEDDAVVLALISGGGSALLEAPRDGISLADLARTTDLLLRAGAPIDALNAVRAPLSRVKAGGLRAAAPTATWVTLILSDVLGNDPRVIASGPTVPNRANLALALSIIDTYGIRAELPPSIAASLERGEPHPGSIDNGRDVMLIVGDNAAAVAAAADEANLIDLQSEIVWSAVAGEASELGRSIVEALANVPEATAVLLGGGEATVTVGGDGRGGRNTELALAAAIELDRRGMAGWVVASLATDGQDAMTGLAGAVADGRTCQRARALGLDAEAALARNDSAAVFEAAGGAVCTGPTGTNVNDLYIAVRVND